MKREVDLGSHSLPHWFKQELTPLHKTNVQGKLHELTDNPVADTPSQSSPVPDKPCGFCGRKHHERMDNISAQELCESRGGRPGLPVPNSFYALCGRKATLNYLRAQELCESRGGRPGLPVPNSFYALCGRKATLNCLRAQELCERRGGRPGLHVPNSPYGLCGREATLNRWATSLGLAFFILKFLLFVRLFFLLLK